MTKTAEVNEFTGRLAELVKQVQAGNEVLLTIGNKPVAKIILATVKEITPGAPLKINSFKDRRVLTPTISQSVEESEAEFRKVVKAMGGPPTKRFTKKDEAMLNRLIHEVRGEMKLSGWPPTKKFTKKDEQELLEDIHEDRKKHRRA